MARGQGARGGAAVNDSRSDSAQRLEGGTARARLAAIGHRTQSFCSSHQRVLTRTRHHSGREASFR